MKHSALSCLGQATAEPPISWLMRTSLEHPKLISLAAGFTDGPTLPIAESRKLLDQVLGSSRSGRQALQYGTTLGDATLRRLTCERVQRMDRACCQKPRGGDLSTDNVVITHGSQQLLYLLTEALCDPGDIVLVEDPTYFVYLGILQSHGIGVRGVRMTPYGVDLAHLESVFARLYQEDLLHKVKLLYIVSYHQNPTARSTHAAVKDGALRLLRDFEKRAGHPIYLLEDAAYRELGFEGEDILSALALDHRGDRVLYAGTYSKPFATGARVGFGILPKRILEVVGRIKANHDFGTASLLQSLLAKALDGGEFDRHLVKLRARYARKAGLMCGAMERHFPSIVQWERPRGGLYVWARLPSRVKTGFGTTFFKKALENEVLYVPGVICYGDDASRSRPDCEMRLSFGGASEGEIAEGIQRLGAALAAFGG